MVCFRLKRHVLNCFILSDYDSLRVYSCYDFICKEIFVVRLSNNQYKSTHNSYNMYEKNKLNINIASIFITLTEINNETHYVAKKN